MNRAIPIVFFLIAISCGSQKESITKKELTESLEQSLDTIDFLRNSDIALQYSDSLLTIDSLNYIGLRSKGLLEFNNDKPEVALSYLVKTVEIEPRDTLSILLLGCSYELLNNLDMALKQYSELYGIIDENYMIPWIRPQLATILEGSERGILVTEEMKEKLSELAYYQLKNDIPKYSDGGLGVFFPFIINRPKSNKFYIKIPDSLFDAGQLNSVYKIENFFAKQGINVLFDSSISANKACTIVTTDMYVEQLEELDTLGIKKL